jgi:hypothetical protein
LRCQLEMPGSLTIRFLALPVAFLFAAVSTGTGLNAIIGIYLAGINADTVISAARHFSVLNESFRQTPVFLQSGENDEVATPADHRSIHQPAQARGIQGTAYRVWGRFARGRPTIAANGARLVSQGRPASTALSVRGRQKKAPRMRGFNAAGADEEGR